MHILTLVLYSVLCSSVFGYGPDYADGREDDDDNSVDDDVGDDDDKFETLNADGADEDDRHDVADRDSGDNDNIQAIKSSLPNEGLDASDDAELEYAKKLFIQGSGTDTRDKSIIDPDVGMTKLNGNDELDAAQYQRELAAGDLAEFLGNAHHQDSWYYKDLSRRFVPVYPYQKRQVKKHHIAKPKGFIEYILSPKQSLRSENREVVPLQAPPEIVLAAMKNGTTKYASKPSEPTEEVIRQYMLRSGDYWDNVWKEEVEPNVLRTSKQQKKTSYSKPITAKLVPGTKLYDLLEKIVKKSPKLVYIISN